MLVGVIGAEAVLARIVEPVDGPFPPGLLITGRVRAFEQACFACVVFWSARIRVGGRMTACGRSDRTTKGTWRMTWRQEAMKDVDTCDKPKGAGIRL